ncbi:MAG: hypothetical protein Q4D02_08335 [Clostridia bacterium]|nr:hypothetical protein [Clostridia bacterium]
MKNKLFNVIFPLWFLLMFPSTWLLVLPANFFVDSIVFLCALKLLDISHIKEIYKKCILKIWLIGFLSDIVGSAVLFTTQFFPSNGIWEDITEAVIANPFSNVFGFIFVLIAFLVSAFLIYFINNKFTFKKCDLENKIKVKIAVILAVFTAPYFFFYPSSSSFYNVKNYELNTNDEHIICEYIDLENI